MSSMTIGILQCDVLRESLQTEFGDYPSLYADLLRTQDPSLQFRTYCVIDHVFPGDIRECDAYLLTGSHHGAYNGLPWIEPTEALIRTLCKADIPVVGICFGHQIIAQALGGKVEKSPKGWGVGVHSWQQYEQPWWMGGESSQSTSDKPTFSLLAIHQDQVTALPEGAHCLAGSTFCPIAAFVVGNKALGIQGHPEFSKGLLHKIMDFRKDSIGDPTYDEGLASLEKEPDTARVAAWMLRFMRGEKSLQSKR